jgi:hypothetical protein
MLAQIGVEAIPVLIHAEQMRSAEPLEAAMVEQFNHCIAYVTPTAEREGFYLDATADRNPIDYLRPDDQGAPVLHVSAEGSSRHEIPYVPPEENAARHTWRIDLRLDGSARVIFVDESNGEPGVVMRYLYGGQQEAIEDELARAFNEDFGQVRFEQVETSDLEDITRSARLEAAFISPSLGAAQGSGRHLPLAFESLGLDGVAVEDESERIYPVVLDRPYSVVSRVHWSLGDAWRVVRLPEEATIEVPGILRYQLRVASDGPGRVVIERDFELRVRRIALADYASFRAALETIRLTEQRSLFVEKHGTGGGR